MHRIDSIAVLSKMAKSVRHATPPSRLHRLRSSILAPPSKLYRAGQSGLHNHARPLGLLHLGAVSHFSSLGGGGGRKPPSGNRIFQSIGIAGSAGLLLLGKGKYILGALKFGKLMTLGSMVITFGSYSMFFGPPYAAGIVGLTLVHETGHALVMLHRGIPFSPMVFIPFMGATVAMKNRPRDAWEEALVAFGGPILGSAGAVGCSLGGYAIDSQLLYAIADFGYFINLINMLPVGMLGKCNSLPSTQYVHHQTRKISYFTRWWKNRGCFISLCWCCGFGSWWDVDLQWHNPESDLYPSNVGWWVADLSTLFQSWRHSHELL